jgi:hypothetical protein
VAAFCTCASVGTAVILLALSAGLLIRAGWDQPGLVAGVSVGAGALLLYGLYCLLVEGGERRKQSPDGRPTPSTPVGVMLPIARRASDRSAGDWADRVLLRGVLFVLRMAVRSLARRFAAEGRLAAYAVSAGIVCFVGGDVLQFAATF